MSVRRSLAWMVMSQGGFFVLQFGGAVVLARLLTPYEMGVYTAPLPSPASSASCRPSG